MKWGFLIGWGIVIYAVVFLMWSLLVIHGFVEGFLPRVILAGTLVAVAFFAARHLRAKRWYEILLYSTGWVCIAVLLDLFSAVPVSGMAVWSDWNIWVGYALLLFAPLAAQLEFRRG